MDRISPNEEGEGFEFENAIVGGVVPREYIPAVEAGFEEAMEKGVLAGYPLIDIKAKLYDGSYHEVDSSEMAFKIAASMALKNAAKICDPVLLEPIMKVEVVVPEEYMGDIMGDITARRGRVEGMEARGNAQVFVRWFRLPKCSDMQQHCVPTRKAAERTRWYLTIMKKCLRIIADEIIKKTSRRIIDFKKI